MRTKLSNVMLEKGITVSDVAKYTGLNAITLNAYYYGARNLCYAKYITVSNICDLLHCEPQDIIDF